jgi:hypothetical protein
MAVTRRLKGVESCPCRVRDPWLGGRTAHEMGFPVTQNPYPSFDDPERNDNHRLWAAGWLDRQAEVSGEHFRSKR